MTTTTIGSRFTASGAAKKLENGQVGREVKMADVDVKTLMTTSAGFAPDSIRDSTVVPIATRTPTLLDRVLATPTDQTSFDYMEETTLTNAAAEVSEGGTYGEATFTFTPRSAPVGKIVAFLPVTDEQLEDQREVGTYIDQRLGFLLRQRLELQMLVGNGTAPNIRGVLNVAGIQTQAKGADTAAVAIRKAKTKIQTPGYAEPDLVVIHPTDTEELDLAAAVDLSAPWVVRESLWDVPRQVTDAITLGTAVIGDFRNFAGLRVRKGITLSVSNSHSTFFIEGKQAIRAEIRVAFPVFRPAAFCSVTGI